MTKRLGIFGFIEHKKIKLPRKKFYIWNFYVFGDFSLKHLVTTFFPRDFRPEEKNLQQFYFIINFSAFTIATFFCNDNLFQMQNKNIRVLKQSNMFFKVTQILDNNFSKFTLTFSRTIDSLFRKQNSILIFEYFSEISDPIFPVTLQQIKVAMWHKENYKFEIKIQNLYRHFSKRRHFCKKGR